MQFGKKSYIKPQLTVYGEVELLTKGNVTGSKLDKDFPSGTPAGNLTFS